MSLVSDAVLTNNPPTKAGYETVKNDFDTWKKSSTELVKLAEAEANVLGRFMDPWTHKITQLNVVNVWHLAER